MKTEQSFANKLDVLAHAFQKLAKQSNKSNKENEVEIKECHSKLNDGPGQFQSDLVECR